MQQNSTTQPVITREEIEKIVGSEQAQFFNTLNPLTLLLLKDDLSEGNIKEKLEETLHKQNGNLPSSEEIESLYQSLKKIAAYIQDTGIDSSEIKFRSVLMGAENISDQELLELNIEIKPSDDPEIRKLIIPKASFALYSDLIIRKLNPGFWNDVVSTDEVHFIFKMPNGEVKKFILSENNRLEIAKLCSQLNGDPIEKTSDLLNYLAENEFYSKFISQIKFI